MMNVKSALFIICLLLICLPGTASRDSSITSNSRYFRFNYANDFFNATDRYYTQGVRLDYAGPFLKRSPVSRILIHAGKKSVNTHGLFLMQECYTPISIRRDTIQTGERPFAAVMYLGEQLISLDTERKQRVSSEIQIGVIGPCAGCRETQVNIHKWLDNIEPLGWQFQVSNDLVLNYNVKYEKLFLIRERLEASAVGAFKAGTLYDWASAGAMFRTGWFDGWNDLEKKSKLNFYIAGWGEARAVGYNATLQGGIFNKDNAYTISSSDIKRLVLLGGGSVFIGYKRFTIEYFKTWISPEFRNGLSHGWGGIGLKFGI